MLTVTSSANKSELRRNQFGGVAGGPFWKDKLFWFTDYQGTRQVQGAETGRVSLPTAAQHQGNFDPAELSGTVDGDSCRGLSPGIAPCIDWPRDFRSGWVTRSPSESRIVSPAVPLRHSACFLAALSRKKLGHPQLLGFSPTSQCQTLIPASESTRITARGTG